MLAVFDVIMLCIFGIFIFLGFVGALISRRRHERRARTLASQALYAVNHPSLPLPTCRSTKNIPVFWNIPTYNIAREWGDGENKDASEDELSSIISEL